MTASLPLALHAAARRRAATIALAIGLPWLLAVVVLAWRFAGSGMALVVFVLAALAVATVTWRRVATLDRAWLVRALDARHPQAEDSSDLLFAADAGLSGLQRLQRERLERRLRAAPPDLRAPWPARLLLASTLLAVAAIAAALAWPSPTPPADAAPPATARTAAAPVATEIRLVEQQLEVVPPAYTGLPARRGEALDARVPEGASLRWRLRLQPAPATAVLVFHDGRRVPLRRDGDDWRADARVERAGLYRIVVDGPLPLRPDRLHRIDVVRDRPPTLRVTAPAQTLVQRSPGQRRWSLAFEARDDHGVAAAADLHLTTAAGSGENISFTEQTLRVTGRGDRRDKRFRYSVDLEALGLSPGDDVIVAFSVRDNRSPRPQATRSASHILRWPLPEAPADAGIDGLVQKVLPAYFRSQRQIIIDAEALIAEKPRLEADDYVARSDAIGVDQRLLRLRYGQFLGEETEGAPKRPLLPTNDAEDEAAAADADRQDADAGDAAHGEDDEHDHGEDGEPGQEGHDHGAQPPTEQRQGLGHEVDVLEEYGHTHDHAEAATLLDPKTRATLKAALDEMWGSEGELRQGRPDRALPYANRALDLIKQVQQADRIYLARVGNAQAEIDMGRRLGGDRTGLRDRRDALRAATAGATAPAALWRALEDTPAAPSGGVDPADAAKDPSTAVALDDFETWLGANADAIDDPLALVAAIDAWRSAPACEDCRKRLRALLWPLLPPPPAPPGERRAPDRAGAAYLDALRGDAR